MDTVLTLLAVAGIATAAWHLLRAAFRFLRRAAARIWADEMAQTRARRGDLTALYESERQRGDAERSAARSGLVALGWLALLVAPTLTPWARAIYAAYTMLLVEPAIRRVRG